MDRQFIAVLFQEGGKLVTELIRNRPFKRTETAIVAQQSVMVEEPPQEVTEGATKPQETPYGVSDATTIAYQNRELGKALLLMELHLQQKCKINETPCDCCEKHPMAIEALSEEALGMTGDPQYSNITAWARRISPITTTAASASGQYDERYPKLAQEARQFRKHIMGTEDIGALISPEDKAKISAKTIEKLEEDLTNE